MRELSGERVLMRIHIGEADRHEGKPLYTAIIDLVRQAALAGTTVFRGAMSFGASGHTHNHRIEALSVDLPMVIECVDTEGKIREILPSLDSMIGGGLITLERANVILYRAGAAE
jgi:PII-like signaling protein